MQMRNSQQLPFLKAGTPSGPQASATFKHLSILRPAGSEKLPATKICNFQIMLLLCLKIKIYGDTFDDLYS